MLFGQASLTLTTEASVLMNTRHFGPLIGSGLATSASVVGLLFAKAHNERTSDQLALDTAVKSLELLVVNEGQYAPKQELPGRLQPLFILGIL